MNGLEKINKSAVYEDSHNRGLRTDEPVIPEGYEAIALPHGMRENLSNRHIK
jgi:hypothetical protein